MSLVGGNPSPRIIGVSPTEGKSHYVLGRDSKSWKTNLPQYRQVKYEEVYEGIDLLYYGNQSELEYDFVVNPDADPSRLRIRFDKAKSLEVDPNGDLLVQTGNSIIRHRKPVAFQYGTEGRRTVAARYVIEEDQQVRFDIATYDRTRTLVIDPVIVYATFLGGDYDDYITAIKVDSAGNIYAAGNTTSELFDPNIFVVKLSPSGDDLLYATTFGGTWMDFAWAMDINDAGEVFVAGETVSEDFPLGPAPSLFNGYIAKLSANGAELLWGNYLGYTVASVGVDGASNVYVTGSIDEYYTESFVPVNAAQTAPAGSTDSFVAKLSPAGHTLYATYLGGTIEDWTSGIAVDVEGNAVVVGTTMSADFPVRNAFQPGLRGHMDGFVTSFDSTGLVTFSTFIGGDHAEAAQAAAISSSGDIFVTGTTVSPDFPTSRRIQRYRGSADAFVTSLTATGTLRYSTYLGGTGEEWAGGIAVDSTGNAYITGQTTSTDYPVFGAIQRELNGGCCNSDGFLSKLSSSGDSLLFSTYFGGGDWDGSYSIAVDPLANAYLAGFTYSADLPVQDPLQPSLNSHAGANDAFIAKIRTTSLAADGYIRVEENARNAQYTGAAWYENTMDGHSSGRAVLASSRGAQAIFTFTGTAVRWIAFQDRWSGIARIYVDGILHGEIDTFSDASQFQSVAYAIEGLPPGTHRLVVEAAGRHNPSGSGDWVWVDGFEYIPAD